MLPPVAQRRYHLLHGGLALAVLAAAYGVFQRGLGLLPCDLCLWQRWPWAAIVVMILVALALPAWRRAMPAGYALAYAASLLLAIYHSGIERGWWQGVTRCSASSSEALTLEELEAMVLAAPPVSCTDIAWQWQGITMANLNGTLALLMLVVTLHHWRRCGRDLA